MKIGTIVLAGAAGLALASAAQADRFASSTTQLTRVSESGALETTRHWSAPKVRVTESVTEQLRDEDRLQAAIAEATEALRTGKINETELLFRPEVLTLDGNVVTPRDGLEIGNGSGASGVTSRTMGVDDGGKFAYFDGFQTYNLGSAGGAAQAELAPMGGSWAQGGLMSFVNAELETSSSSNDPGSANLQNPRNPFGTPANYPEGNTTIEQVLRDDLNTLASIPTAGVFLRQLNSTDALFQPTLDQDLIIGLDSYFNNLDLLDSFDMASSAEGFVLTRILDGGFNEASPLTSMTGGRLDRPAVLGPLANTFGFGTFYVPPLNPMTSGGNPSSIPSRFQTQTGEWFTYVISVSLTTGLTVWVRNSQTDGSNGVLIEDGDPNIDPSLSSGWYRVFPGRVADEVMAPAPGMPGIWRGYGIAVDQFDRPAIQTPIFLAATTADDLAGLFFAGSATPADTSNWMPDFRYKNNYTVIGSEFDTPPTPKRRLPYKDDIELYFQGMALTLVPGFFDALSSRAVVAFGSFNGFSVNSSPSPGSDGGTSNQSIAQRNVTGDNAMRSEFNTTTPTGTQRPIAEDGNAVTASAMIRMTSIQTVRGMNVQDTQIDGLNEFLIISVVDSMGNIDPAFHIRRENPFFDEDEPTAPSAQVFSAPNLDANTANLNFPTSTSVAPLTDAGGSGGAFFKAELTLSGDGTGFWSINGNRLEFVLSGSVFDSGQIAELEADFEMAQMIAGEPVGPPYSRFLTDMTTLNQIAFWSGNQDLGFNDRIFVDDICVDGVLRVRSPGPAYELPFCEDFENHFVDKSIAGNGNTNLAAVGSPSGAGVDFQQRTILATEDDALGDGSTEWCSYTVAETFDGDPAWGVMVGDVLFVRKPFAGFDCPDRDNIPTIPNLTLVDSDEMGLDPFPVRVGAPSDVMGNGSAADIRATYTRYDSEALFCRYEILSIEAEENPGAGGAPFSIPSELAVGNILAVASPFADCVTRRDQMTGDAIASNANFVLFEDELCEFASATLLLLNPPDMARTGTPDLDFPPVTALDTDIRGYGINTTPVNLWTGVISTNTGAVTRLGVDEMDEVLGVSIDPMGARGNVLSHFNPGGTVRPVTGGGTQNSINVPTVVAAAATSEATEIRARACWDYYIQDNNTRIFVRVNGPRFNSKGQAEGATSVVDIRYGGPPANPPSTSDPIGNNTEIAHTDSQAPGAANNWVGTGTNVPLGQWFTTCVEVDFNGDWTLELNGNVIASGASSTLPTGDITSPIGISSIGFTQGFDEEGAEAPDISPFIVRSLGPDGVGLPASQANSYCFYSITDFDDDNPPDPMGMSIHPVNAVTGEVLLDMGSPVVRQLVVTDLVAVRFFDSGGLLNSFDDCPTSAPFQILDSSDNLIAEGDWFLTGVPGADVPASLQPPIGGVSNPTGPAGSNQRAYNWSSVDNNAPHRNMIIAEPVTLPVIQGPPNVASQWWIDDIKLEQLGGDEPTPPCPWDLTGSGSVGAADLGFLLGCWGTNPSPTCQPADFNNDNAVGAADLGTLLGNWGACPQ
ncbi:MAG: hypothetical protein EA376_10045 [Phycisphaeraceae bacterium]|nr:MAG: hypothetical protein EA376_10045 [Phycisphaeraceae bacterium]